MISDNGRSLTPDPEAGNLQRVQEYTGSEIFSRTFEEGMKLVEETAEYLDGPGREECRALPRSGALAYAGESMRLTTRLMQVASWLLVQRAVREGEMSAEQAADGKYRLAGDESESINERDRSDIPARLQDLMARARTIYDQAQRVDQGLYVVPESANPVGQQVARLRSMFEE